MAGRIALFAYLAALAVGLFQSFRPTWQSGFAVVQTERGDGMLNHYILEHAWQSLTRPDYCGSLFSPPCFYPQPATLWYSEHLLGTFPVYGAWRAWLTAETAFSLWQITLTAFDFVAFALVLRWFRAPHALAVLGGYLWAFALVHVDQLKHQQMIPRFWVPLAVYHAAAFVSALRSGPDEVPAAGFAPGAPLRHVAALAAVVWLQCVSCVYTGWFLTTGLATFLPLAVLACPGAAAGLRDFLRRNRRALLVLGGVWLAAMAAAFVPYMVVNRDMARSYAECVGLMPSPSAWFTGLPGTPWHDILAPLLAPVSDECRLFCGFGMVMVMGAALAALVVGLVRYGRRSASAVPLAALVTAAVWVVLTLADDATGEQSLWQYVRYLPGGLAIRCVSRVYVTVYAFGWLGALIWLSDLTESVRPGWRELGLGVVAVLCIAEQQGYDPPGFDRCHFYPLADRLAEILRRGDAAYVVPRYTDPEGVVWDGVYGQVLAMWAGLRANVPVVNGYSGRLPSGPYPPYHAAVADDHLRNWLAGRFRGRLVIVSPDDPGGGRLIFCTD